MKRLALIGSLALLATGACSSVQPAVRAAYTNPVLDADFPDPTIILASDGFYYGYATQTERNGKMINIQVARSADLVHWEHLGDALPTKPVWAGKTQDFWAPHVSRHGKTYHLYYSAKPDAALADEKQGLCLAVAVSISPAGPFTDMGHPLQCGESFVNIDPMEFDDPATGKHLLYWGSGFGPIKVQALAPDLMSFAAGTTPTALVFPVKSDDPTEYQKLIEGAWVVRRDGFYYLFYSGDNCCGPRAHYAALVARSKSATGPFETMGAATGTGSSVVLQARGTWVAPGHNSVVTDAAGRDWLAYHAVDVRKPRGKPSDDVNTRRVMLIDPIDWRGGWPAIAGPSAELQTAPRTRR